MRRVKAIAVLLKRVESETLRFEGDVQIASGKYGAQRSTAPCDRASPVFRDGV